MAKTLLKILLPVVVLAASVAVASAIVRNAPEKQPRERETYLPPVSFVRAAPEATRLDVVVHGTVLPRTEISLVPRVSGRVEFVAETLRPGGFFAKDDVLVRLEIRDYELAVTQAAAGVAQAKALLDRENAEAEIARREWERYGKGEPNDLVLRKPQLAEAEAMLASAKARLAVANLDLDRTTIVAPFDGRVRTESVDEGQFLGAGSPIASIFATDHVEVRLSVPLDRLDRLDLPLSDGEGSSSPAPAWARPGAVEIRADLAGRTWTWPGTVVRTEAELAPRSRDLLARVRVDDPFGREHTERAPLLVGMFVEATLPGRTVDAVTVVPVVALRDGDRVGVLDEEDRLRLRSVTVLRREADEALVTGLREGDRVVVTRVTATIDGMRVRVLATPEEDET